MLDKTLFVALLNTYNDTSETFVWTVVFTLIATVIWIIVGIAYGLSVLIDG